MVVLLFLFPFLFVTITAIISFANNFSSTSSSSCNVYSLYLHIMQYVDCVCAMCPCPYAWSVCVFVELLSIFIFRSVHLSSFHIYSFVVSISFYGLKYTLHTNDLCQIIWIFCELFSSSSSFAFLTILCVYTSIDMHWSI